MSIENLGRSTETFFRAARRFGYGTLLATVLTSFSAGVALGYFWQNFNSKTQDNESSGKVLKAQQDLGTALSNVATADRTIDARNSEISALKQRLVDASTTETDLRTQLTSFKNANKANAETYQALAAQYQALDGQNKALEAKLDSLLHPARDPFYEELTKVEFVKADTTVTLFSGNYVFQALAGSSLSNTQSCGFSLKKTSISSGGRSTEVARKEMSPGDSYPTSIDGREISVLYSGNRFDGSDFICEFHLLRR